MVEYILRKALHYKITIFTCMFVINDFDTASTCEPNILAFGVVTGIINQVLLCIVAFKPDVLLPMVLSIYGFS